MAKFKFLSREQTKGALVKGTKTMGEVAAVGGAMIISKKFLDFNTLFKNQIAKNPDFANRWFIKQQGLIKFVGGAILAAMIPNPWLKLLFIGMAAEGFITQVRLWTTAKDGTAFFDKIGQRMTDDDKELEQAATEYERQLLSSGTGQSITQQYPEMVGQSITQQYPEMVGKRSYINASYYRLENPLTTMVHGI